jgi:hypothetical protein
MILAGTLINTYYIKANLNSVEVKKNLLKATTLYICTPAGFDLTTHNSAGADGTTRPCHLGCESNVLIYKNNSIADHLFTVERSDSRNTNEDVLLSYLKCNYILIHMTSA